VLNEYEKLFSPELFIIGGGVSENFDKFSHKLKLRAHILPAHLRNEAGLIGAAFAALQ
jgi:polyphosphate glucokinase